MNILLSRRGRSRGYVLAIRWIDRQFLDRWDEFILSYVGTTTLSLGCRTQPGETNFEYAFLYTLKDDLTPQESTSFTITCLITLITQCRVGPCIRARRIQSMKNEDQKL
jgi:hypothetical protein